MLQFVLVWKLVRICVNLLICGLWIVVSFSTGKCVDINLLVVYKKKRAKSRKQQKKRLIWKFGSWNSEGHGFVSFWSWNCNFIINSCYCSCVCNLWVIKKKIKKMKGGCGIIQKKIAIFKFLLTCVFVSIFLI